MSKFDGLDMSREELFNAMNEEGQAKILPSGAAVVTTGLCTGRSPDAKFIVCDSQTRDTVDWSCNQAITRDEFNTLRSQITRHMETLTKLSKPYFTQTLYGGRDESRQLGLTVHTSTAWQALFANNMFVRHRKSRQKPDASWELFCFPEFDEVPTVMLDITQQQIIIKGTWYAGEIKKSVFTALNYIMPSDNVLPMHCSVNTDERGTNTAIFFGLSGTGKTTLSADSDRILIGDDEHGWSDDGVFNFEGGCYAKVIRLSATSEPEIWEAVQQPGAILENVVVTDEGIPQFHSQSLTENTRGSYPINHIPNASLIGHCGHPQNIIFLTCDAFGVLPPVSQLSVDEAVSHFLMGYTAKVAGTEAGVVEPTATFSHCYGAPFMPRAPSVYASLLKEKIEKSNTKCWLVNTGWTAGPYGVGTRMPIEVSRLIINLILSDKLSTCAWVTHPPTGLTIPSSTPSTLLNKYIRPEYTWVDGGLYDKTVNHLMKMWKQKLEEINSEH